MENRELISKKLERYLLTISRKVGILDINVALLCLVDNKYLVIGNNNFIPYLSTPIPYTSHYKREINTNLNGLLTRFNIRDSIPSYIAPMDHLFSEDGYMKRYYVFGVESENIKLGGDYRLLILGQNALDLFDHKDKRKIHYFLRKKIESVSNISENLQL
ncbi:MAG: hypothetical protein WC501_03640 [Candidatus Micrarchaeia archaeon]